MISPIITGGYGGYEGGNGKFADVDWSKNQHNIEFIIATVPVDIVMKASSHAFEVEKQLLNFAVNATEFNIGVDVHNVLFVETVSEMCATYTLNAQIDNALLVNGNIVTLNYVPVKIIEIYVNEIGVIDNHDDIILSLGKNLQFINNDLDGYTLDIKYQYK